MSPKTKQTRQKFNSLKKTNRYKNFRKRQYVYQLGRCCYCKRLLKNVPWHFEHIRPVSQGGVRVNNYANLALSCPSCNIKKGAMRGVQYPQWILDRKQMFEKVSAKEIHKLYYTLREMGR